MYPNRFRVHCQGINYLLWHVKLSAKKKFDISHYAKVIHVKKDYAEWCRIIRTLGKPIIMVDADSCPVKEEIVEIANSFTVDAVFVASYAHMQNDLNGAVWKFVDSSKEAADLFIMNYVKSGDAVVTQDIGLASTLLLKGVYVLSPRGILFEESEIRTALEMRHLSAKARRRGVYGKGPKPFRQEDRSRFVQQLTKILSNFEGIQ